MKVAIQLSLLALICTGHALLAQAPKGINYQGIARDMDGKPLAQKEITIQISILKGSATGELEYDEIHELRTNSFGLFTLVIGQGQAGTGSFGFISWALGDKWLQIELDENGGRNFKLMGTQQLMSVPYALYAEYAGNGYAAGNGISISNNTITNTGDGDTSSSNELISSVSFGVDNKLKITDAGGTKEADLSSLVGASQNLNSVLAQGNSAGGVSISNLGSPVGNTDAATKAYVDGHADADADPANEIQDLTLVANNLRLTNNPGASDINLTPYLDNTDNQNLSSSASGTNRTINISGGASTTISVADNDNSIANEIQDLNLSANTLSLSSDPTPVDLTPFLDNTDNQNLTSSVSGTNRTINISGGTGTTINVADNDNSVTNEIQTISTQSVDANTRSLTLTSANTVNVDVRDADSNSTNEAQTLSKAGATVSLTNVSGAGGGSFVLNDDSNTNEAQTITRAGSNVTLTTANGAGGGSFSVNDNDSNATNEAQTLSKSGSTVTLSNVSGAGGGSFVVNDDSNTNEAQTISRTGSNVTLAPANGAGGGSFSIDDNDASPTNELQNLTQVLSTGNNAGANRIANVGNPTATQDATTKSYVDAADLALSNRIANNYAFKVTYNHTHTSPGTQVVTISNEDFDDFSLVSSNSYTAPENGTYHFAVTGISPIGGIAMQFRITPLAGPVELIDIKRQIGYPNSMIINYYDNTVVKLNTGDVVELIVTSGITNEVVTGSFFGFKL